MEPLTHGRIASGTQKTPRQENSVNFRLSFGRLNMTALAACCHRDIGPGRHSGRRPDAQPPIPHRRHAGVGQDDARVPVPAGRRAARRARALRDPVGDRGGDPRRRGVARLVARRHHDPRTGAPSEQSLEPDEQYTVFHPSEVELSETTKKILDDVEQLKPARIVFDSLSELRLLAGNPLRYRRQILALKQFFAGRRCTVLLLDDLTAAEHDLQVQSIAHGALLLEHTMPDFGGTRRRLQRHEVPRQRLPRRLPRLRDPARRAGGVSAPGRRRAPAASRAASACRAGWRAWTAARRRPRARHQHADPGRRRNRQVDPRRRCSARGRPSAASTRRCSSSTRAPTRCSAGCDGLGIPLKKHVDAGHDQRAADRSRRAFARRVRARDPRARSRSTSASIVVIDSLNGYLNSMPDEQFLIIQLHELLTYLGQRGVATVLVAAHHGLIGSHMTAPVDASYLADAVVLLRYFEADGEVQAGDLGGQDARRRARAHHPRVHHERRPDQRRRAAARLPRRADRRSGEEVEAVSRLPDERLERRLLILAPVGKDAALVEAMLRKEGGRVRRVPRPRSPVGGARARRRAQS